MAASVLALQGRNRKLLVLERCWDYSNFNTQHSLLQQFFWHTCWANTLDPETKATYPVGKPAQDAFSYVSLAVVRSTIIWQDGSISVKFSGLDSGQKLTTEGNTWSGITYDGPLLGSTVDFFMISTILRIRAPPALGHERHYAQGYSEAPFVAFTCKLRDDAREAIESFVGDPAVVNRTLR